MQNILLSHHLNIDTWANHCNHPIKSNHLFVLPLWKNIVFNTKVWSLSNFILLYYYYSNLVIHSIVGDVLIVVKLLNSICHWYLWIKFFINYKFFESSTFDLDNVSCYLVKWHPRWSVPSLIYVASSCKSYVLWCSYVVPIVSSLCIIINQQKWTIGMQQAGG